MEEAKISHFSAVEKDFFDDYSIADLIDENSYFHSRSTLAAQNSDDESEIIAPFLIPEELKRDFTNCKVAELKEECRARGLPVSGTKAVLLERIEGDVEEQILELRRQHTAKTRLKGQRPQVSGMIERGARPVSQSISSEAESYLEGLVKEYLKASGGHASSRDIGRYLAANAGSMVHDDLPELDRMTALSELKSLYGGLNSFITNRQDSFEKFDDGSPDRTAYEYLVALRE